MQHVFAGIIGLCTAHALLQNTDLSIALIERNQQVPGASLNNGAATGAGRLLQVSHHPCSALTSSTPRYAMAGIVTDRSRSPAQRRRTPQPWSWPACCGTLQNCSTFHAGQGYIWLAHRDPASAAWQLAQDSCARWQRLLEQPHLSPSHVEWQSSGSLLLATDAAEAEQLRARQELLGRAGVAARYLDERALRCEEPALHDGMAGGLLVSNDSQLVRLSPCQDLSA